VLLEKLADGLAHGSDRAEVKPLELLRGETLRVDPHFPRPCHLEPYRQEEENVEELARQVMDTAAQISKQSPFTYGPQFRSEGS
jgi:hypothetical protein